MQRMTCCLPVLLLWLIIGRQSIWAQELPTTVQFDEENHFAVAVEDSQLMLVDGVKFTNARISIENRLAVRQQR